MGDTQAPKAIAMIAEKHLFSQAKEVIKRFLGNERLADVALWADEVIHTPAYKSTASWHYLNIPIGLDYTSFERAVKGQDAGNVYSALLQNEEIFTSEGSSYEERKDALKFIVHLVGDMHQPMHVSRTIIATIEKLNIFYATAVWRAVHKIVT